MARKQTTTYECDTCGKKVENGKALRSILVEVSRHGRSEAIERFDVCTSCQTNFAVWLGDFTLGRVDAEQFKRQP